MWRLLFPVLLLAVVAAAAAPWSTVAKVDLARYEGRWFEIAKYPDRFQSHCARDTTATHTRRGDGSVRVVDRDTIAAVLKSAGYDAARLVESPQSGN